MSHNKVRWNEIRAGYNRIYKTNYKNTHDFLFFTYGEIENLKKMEKIFGVSHPAIRSEMIRQGIPRLPKGHRGYPAGLIKIRKLGDVSGLQCCEIARKTGLSQAYAGNLVRTYGIAYRRRGEK